MCFVFTVFTGVSLSLFSCEIWRRVVRFAVVKMLFASGAWSSEKTLSGSFCNFFFQKEKAGKIKC